MSKIEPLVSVCCIAYNQENYIKDAIEGFLMQQTDFKFEIIIHDDCSTDNTANIIRAYQEKHPESIVTILQTENQKSKGKAIFPITYQRARGRYIALCEGDDYWTDPFKLQKQVDFLYNHPDCAICFHNVSVIYENRQDISHPFYGQRPNRPNMQKKPKRISTLEDQLKGNFIQTPSVMFRAGLFNEFPDWYYGLDRGDWPLHILNAEHGYIFYSDEIMAKYRVHSGGIYSSKNKIDQLKGALHVASTIDKHLNYQFHTILSQTKALYLAEIIRLSHADGDYLKIFDVLKFIFKYRVASIQDITVLIRLFNWYFPRVYRLISNML